MGRLHMWRLIIALVLVACAIAPAIAQSKKGRKQPDKGASASFTVRVLPVITFDGPERAVLKQCIFRELRKIPELVVVEDQDKYNRYELQIVVITTENQSGYKTGYASAVTVSTPLNTMWLDSLLTTEQDKSLAASQLSGALFLESQFVMTSPSLSGLCTRIIANFDSKNVESLRQIMQKFQ